MTSDPIYGRRVRALMPRPFTSNIKNTCAFSTTPTHCSSLQNPNIPSWNQPLSGLSDYGAKREINRGLPLVSSRWNPTPEQLQALEEMYRRGTRTPSAEQIQQIAAKLRRFGKIEGKNVFYWFQNHKARDRQRKRRQLELLAGKDDRDSEIPQRKQSGLSRRCLEIEHPRKSPTSSNCSTASKKSESVRGAVVQECKRDELQQKITDEKATGQENAYPFVTLNFCKLLAPKNDCFRNFESGNIKENQTLQLFPIRSNDLSTVKEESCEGSSIGTTLAPNQFFEFLPTKN